MKTHGFTLIELLVVVLIIGILSAIAVPQYYKILYKTRYAKAMKVLLEIKASADRYAALHGQIYYNCPGTSSLYGAEIYNLDIVPTADTARGGFTSVTNCSYFLHHTSNSSPKKADDYYVALQYGSDATVGIQHLRTKTWYSIKFKPDGTVTCTLNSSQNPECKLLENIVLTSASPWPITSFSY